MSNATKRRIQVASFSMNDISSGHLLSMALGVVLIVGSAVLAVASNSNARAAADSKGAARLLLASANQAITGGQMYIGGGSERLSAAVAGSGSVNAAFADVGGSANSVLVAPALKQPAGEAYGAWGNLSAALTNISLPASLALDLSEATGKAVGLTTTLVKKLEATGRQNGALAKSYESAVRLYSYSEAGFGVASVPRVEYDLQTLLSELGQTELRADVAYLEPLLATARNAAAKKPTREQLTAVYEAGVAAKSAAESLGGAAVQAQAAMYLGIGAAVLAVLGLAGVVGGLRSATSEFSKRYARSVQQFRGDEQAREQLMAGLREAANGSLAEDIHVSANSGEIAELVTLVNNLLGVVRDRVESANAAMSGSVESGARALGIVERASESGGAVEEELSGAVRVLSECAEQSTAISLDSRALSSAATEAAARSADATRVAQDAASRLEAMREGLQDTAKRIKRLGERSQEINSVVDAMELMSEQIGVLALNASLEAERAGEAGAGFRLVAREVQALANRSDEALERISGLVQGVQSDARAAAESVERSTSQVVAGANVGAVSQALLNVLAPLAESISTMANGLEAGAQTNAVAVNASARAADEVKRLVGDMVGRVRSLREPVTASRDHLRSGITALAEMQSGTETI
jgi:methyl-accepting chemotaxis protein